MKTVFIASVLVAASFAASAMSGNHQIWSYKEAAAGPGKTRAEVIAELQVAKAAGLVNLTDSQMRHAEDMQLRTKSTLTREQVQQEVIAVRKQGLLENPGR